MASSPARTPVPVPVDVTVAGGTLAAFRYGAPDAPPARTVLAVHGITASSRAWAAVGRSLPEGWSLVAVDLRGRGGSRDLPGPTGLARHVDDLERVVAQLDPSGSGELVLTGHSLGAYVALLLAAESPQRFRRLVLVDGGVPLPVPDDVDLDDLLQATLGPALTRLSQTFSDAEAYVDLFRAHPALGPHWSADVETYVRYDALETPDGVRSRAVEEAVRADGRDLLGLGQRIDQALRGLTRAHDVAGRPARHVRRGPRAAAGRRRVVVRRDGAVPGGRDRRGRQPLHDPVRPGRGDAGDGGADRRVR